VPQHQQFDVLSGGRATEQDQPAAEPSEDKVEQAKGHGRSSCPTADLCHIAAAHRPSRILAPRRMGDEVRTVASIYAHLMPGQTDRALALLEQDYQGKAEVAA
jgi:hypothetical protein